MKAISIRLFNSENMNNANIPEKFDKQWWTQFGKTGSLKDFKKRVLDHLNAAGFKIEGSDLRLWYLNQTEGA